MKNFDRSESLSAQDHTADEAKVGAVPVLAIHIHPIASAGSLPKLKGLKARLPKLNALTKPKL